MEPKKTLLLFGVISLAVSNAKTYDRCTLARELIDIHKFDYTMLSSCKLNSLYFLVYRSDGRIELIQKKN